MAAVILRTLEILPVVRTRSLVLQVLMLLMIDCMTLDSKALGIITVQIVYIYICIYIFI